jgi:acyl-CoA reductase-like NAD-dependent aldehyde dehydrogenase
MDCLRLRSLRSRIERDYPVIEPHADHPERNRLLENGGYFAPLIVVCSDPTHEIVQEESFGPILVVQPADSFDHAMQLLNGVRQGLVAALFSNDEALQKRFLREAQAGILKINQATADADAVSPFGGWKASGVGPPEHGIADREFFTRWQTVYSA